MTGNALSIDDEYANASTRIPKILLTTSRDPSSRLQQFAKEMKLMFPNSQRINRGNHVIPDIVKACKSSEITDLIVLHEHRGIPDGMIVSHFPYGPTAYFSLHNVRLRHDIPECQNKTISEANPHMIFHNFATKLGQRVKTILQHLFPIPKLDSKRVMTFSNDSDFISFRYIRFLNVLLIDFSHHSYSGNLKADLELEELGPRFEMRLYEIKLGTIEMDEADSEWSLRPYMNTARKRDML